MTNGLEARGVAGDFLPDEGFVQLSDGAQLGLWNISRQLSTVDESEWPAEVDRFLDVLLDTQDSVEALPFDEVWSRLRVRVAEPAAIGVATDAFVTRHLAGDLFAYAVVDEPDQVKFVPVEAPISWEVDEQDVYDIAVEQTLSEPVDAIELETGEIEAGNDYYAASRILDPTTFVDDIPPEGLVISIPTSSVLFAVPTDVVTMDLLVQFNLVNHESFATEPNTASDDMYWWRHGALEVIETTESSFQLPEELEPIVIANGSR